MIKRLEEFDNTLFFYATSPMSIEIPNEVKIWQQKASEIQSRFDFVIPNYILDEIIEHENSNYKDNLYYLINCAVMNNRITIENAKKIREVYWSRFFYLYSVYTLVEMTKVLLVISMICSIFVDKIGDKNGKGHINLQKFY